jgi:voltage-gated potassium channel Kch
LFFLESGSVSGPVPVELEIARIAAPVVPAWTVIKALALIFRGQMQLLRLRFIKDHVVICGLGKRGFQLAKDFRREGCDVVCIEIDEGNERIARCRHLGACVLIGNATDSGLLQQARVDQARYLVAVCGNDATNMETAIMVYQIVHARDERLKNVVRCYVHIVDLKLCALFKHHRIFVDIGDPYELIIFSIYENGARLLFGDHPLDPIGFGVHDPRTIHLVIIGFGRIGESVALQAARIAHFANGKKLKVSIIDRKNEDRKNSFFNRYPAYVDLCDVVSSEGEDIDCPDVIARIVQSVWDPNIVTRIVICRDNDTDSLSCAFELSTKLKDKKVPIMVHISEHAGLVTLLDTRESSSDWMPYIHPFGMTEQICTKRMLLNEELDRIAKEIHRDYVSERLREGWDEHAESLRPWDFLDEDLKDSSRQQADHLSVKLRAIGCCRSSDERGSSAVTEFTAEETELLARMEHARFCAERLLAGWEMGEIKDIKKRMTPHLVDLSSLVVPEYDRRAVSIIPRILEQIGEKVYRCSVDELSDQGNR